MENGGNPEWKCLVDSVHIENIFFFWKEEDEKKIIEQDLNWHCDWFGNQS